VILHAVRIEMNTVNEIRHRPGEGARPVASRPRSCCADSRREARANI